MYYPYCKRKGCHSKNNFGFEICFSCKITIAFAREVNTALDAFNSNKTKAMVSLGINSYSFFYKLIQQVPEIYNAWDDIEGVEMDSVRKIYGTKIYNKASKQEIVQFNKIMRMTDYRRLPHKTQEEFVKWLVSQKLDRISTKDILSKILEYSNEKKVIVL